MDQLKIETQQFWDENPCEGEWDNPINKQNYRYIRAPYIKEVIEKYISNSQKVLEVGCGQGIDLCLIASRSRDAYAIDMSPKSLEIAKNTLNIYGVKATLSVGDAENLEFKDNTFDVVYSCGVIHHTPDTQKAAKEIYRVTKKGGKAIILLYSKSSLQYPIFWLLRVITKPFRKKLAHFTRVKKKNRLAGSSVAELFGVPILKAYTNRELKKMFSDFSNVSINKYQTGFYRFIGVNKNETLTRLIYSLEGHSQRFFGFHSIIIAEK